MAEDSLKCWAVNTINPLDSEFCRNIIESAKRKESQPVMKKAYFHRNYKGRCILDFYNKRDANLKNLREGGGGGVMINYANYFEGSTFFLHLEWGGSPQNW